MIPGPIYLPSSAPFIMQLMLSPLPTFEAGRRGNQVGDGEVANANRVTAATALI